MFPGVTPGVWFGVVPADCVRVVGVVVIIGVEVPRGGPKMPSDSVSE